MASASRGLRILLGVLVCVLVLMVAAGIFFAWLVPRVSHPIEIELPQRSVPSTSLQADCGPRDTCVPTRLASR